PIQHGDAPKPAGDPQILLHGWNYNADTHETLTTFTWGPDGWLYGCHGVFCPSFVGKPGTPQKERQRMDAGVWRYHPTKDVFEVFAEGTSNPWGIDFDEYGQCFIEACVIPHLWHMIQGGRFERQGGQHFNINREETLAHEGYHADPNQWFINPFIYDDIKTIGDHVHYAGTKGPHAGNGRIFKIVYGDTKWTPVNLEKLSDEELVKLVPSKNEWMGRHARRILQERFSKYLPALSPNSGATDEQVRQATKSFQLVGNSFWKLLKS